MQQVLGALHYWLEMGVDGLRLDAIPYLVEREGTSCENLPETHTVLKRIRAEIDAHYADRMLLAEANQWPEDTYPYFGDGDECHMAFHFPLMPRMYMAIAQEDRNPITDIMRQTPEIPESCQWAIFLRNHDELTLEMVTQNEREYLWNTYAADRRMRINLGIRRRLAPLLDNDRRKIELMNALLLSMPGTPVIYYGDEIGMGDNIYLGDRDGVRTPMQWSPDRNGGFSPRQPAAALRAADPGPDLRLPGGQRRGAAAEPGLAAQLDEAADRACAAGAAPSAAARSPSSTRATARSWPICASSRARRSCASTTCRATRRPATWSSAAYRDRVPVELLGRTVFPPVSDPAYRLTLPGYGFYWLALAAGRRARQLAPAHARAAARVHHHRARRQLARHQRKPRRPRARPAGAAGVPAQAELVQGSGRRGRQARPRRRGARAAGHLSPGRAGDRARRHQRAVLLPAVRGRLGRGEPGTGRAAPALHAGPRPPRAAGGRALRRHPRRRVRAHAPAPDARRGRARHRRPRPALQLRAAPAGAGHPAGRRGSPDRRRAEQQPARARRAHPAQGLPPARGRPASRARARPLPHRRRRLRPHAAAAGLDRACGRRRHAHRAWPRRSTSSPTRATAGSSPSTISTGCSSRSATCPRTRGPPRPSCTSSTSPSPG